MTELDLEVLCELVNINEDIANDAFRTVRLLCAAPPHGILLPQQEVPRVLKAVANLYIALPENEAGPRGFYKFVEDIVTLLKQSSIKQLSRSATKPMRA